MYRSAVREGLSEESDQVLLVNWFARTYPDLAHRLHHSPNGGHRHKATAARMKLMGTRAGFHDLVLFYPVGNWSGLVIELKHGKGRMSPAQKAWVPVYQECGFYTRTCWGLQEAQQTMEAYINGKY